MKCLVFIPLVLTLLVLPGSQKAALPESATVSSEAASPLVGAWELLNKETGETIQIKIFSEGHFALVFKAGLASTGTYRSAVMR